jgi:hypothetical protein
MLINYYKGQIEPNSNDVYVFGSSKSGEHIYGYSKIAKDYFGAIDKIGEGLVGNSYALPLYEKVGKHDISDKDILESLDKLYKAALSNPSKKFKISFSKCLDNALISGHTELEIAELFKQSSSNKEFPSNLYFPEHWSIVLEK